MVSIAGSPSLARLRPAIERLFTVDERPISAADIAHEATVRPDLNPHVEAGEVRIVGDLHFDAWAAFAAHDKRLLSVEDEPLANLRPQRDFESYTHDEDLAFVLWPLWGPHIPATLLQ
jgi:hypothetical protein